MKVKDGDMVTLQRADGWDDYAKEPVKRSLTGRVHSFEQDGVKRWELVMFELGWDRGDPVLTEVPGQVGGSKQYPAIGFDPETASLSPAG